MVVFCHHARRGDGEAVLVLSPAHVKMVGIQVFTIVHVLVAAGAASLRQVPETTGGLSLQCNEQISTLYNHEVVKNVAKCEDDHGIPAKVLQTLQSGNVKRAKELVVSSFTLCANFSDTCAEKVGDRLIDEMMNPGTAISDSCQKQVKDVQDDPVVMKQVGQCEKDGQLVERIHEEIGKGDMSSAIEAARGGLLKCMGVSASCAAQLAPVIVNNVLIQGTLQSEPVTLAMVALPPSDLLRKLTPSLMGSSLSKMYALVLGRGQ